jgi:hypothetical protein
LKFLILIDGEILSVCFHLGFLFDADKIPSNFGGYDQAGNPVAQDGRKYDYEKWNSLPGIQFEQFKGYHFEKWHKMTTVRKKIHNDFSIIVGFTDY